MITVRAIVPDVVNTAGRGVFGPPDAGQLVQWLNYLKEDGITLNDKLEVIRPEPTLTDVGCVQLNSTGMISTGVRHHQVQQTGLFDIEFLAKRPDTTATHRVFYPLASDTGGSTGWRIQFVSASNNLNMYIAHEGNVILNASFFPLPDTTEAHHYRFIGDGTNVAVYTDHSETPASTQPLNTANFGGDQLIDTEISASTTDLGVVSMVGISTPDSATDFLYPLEETDGSIAYDVTGNGNDGTISGDYAHVTLDGIFSWNQLMGFDKYDTFNLILAGVPPDTLNPDPNDLVD